MKKLLIILLSSLMIGMVGCNNAQDSKSDSELFDEAMKKGKVALTEGEYTEARDMFKLALEAKDDEEAAKLKQQSDIICEVGYIICEPDFENISYEMAIESIESYKDAYKLCDKVMEIDSESDVAKDQARYMKGTIKELIELLEKYISEYN